MEFEFLVWVVFGGDGGLGMVFVGGWFGFDCLFFGGVDVGFF